LTIKKACEKFMQHKHADAEKMMKRNIHILLKESLNEAQFKAVCFTEGPLLVIAGAGTGKTRTLTCRVARLVEEGISPNSILLLTFTRKAAQEMLKRAAQLLDNRCEKVSGGTFHSFANAVLRKYAGRIGFDSGFSILDRPDAEGLISILRKELTAVSEYRSFPQKHTLLNIFSKSVNKASSVEDVIFSDYPHFGSYLTVIAELYKKYKKHKEDHHFMDYDDLLVHLYHLLKNDAAVRDSISSQYRYVMVDEYQDTNQIQADIIALLAGKNKNIMAVGDDSQSIYSFRGANFKNIMNFPGAFPGTQIIRLEENYRSIQPILTLSNAMIERAREKYTKALFTRKKGGSKPVLIKCGSENSQSRFVVEKIKELNREEGVPLSRIAVLFRAGYHSFDLEIELGRDQIPFIKMGGFKFMESAHIKDVLAHLKVIANPSDRISWYRILLLIDHIGPKTAQNIYETVLKEKSPINGLLIKKIRSGNNKGMDRLRDLFLKIDSQHLSVAEAGETIFRYYYPILKERYDDHPKRAKDLEQLVTIMERYKNIEKFLTDMALDPPSISMDDTFSEDCSDDSRLVLSTVHSAKGLEWHSVFIIWVLDGRFPSMQALHREEEIEEERRLMYVSATRAQENLFFIYPMQAYDRSSGIVLNRPSRFLDMIPADMLEEDAVDIYSF
jgi:DNA helicase-2/ATP-dependent DNA helicase PcrA